MSSERGQWASRIGFILAAAGSAVGLGNLWKFPYITGANGGGIFVLIYLVCIALIGLPIMMGEVLIGRSAQTSTVGSFRVLNDNKRSPWMGVGWIGVAAAFVILSYYSVVAGWAMHYMAQAIGGTFSASLPAAEAGQLFDNLYKDTSINILWHFIFMALTIGIVIGGVQKGVERASRILMPALFVMLLLLLGYAMTLSGFGKAVDFVFAPHFDKLTAGGVLEALGHSFFTLSVGMGAMLTYGSYLGKQDNIIAATVTITLLDTAVALVACLVLFPITYSYGMEPSKTVGLIFINMPVAFSQMPMGSLWAAIFFLLLTFAALTSAISLLEVAAAYFIDERGMSRKNATLLTGGSITLLGIPSALSGGTKFFGDDFASIFSNNWFDAFDYLASNWLLPIGALGIALFAAWRMGDKARREGFVAGSSIGMKIYAGWLVLRKYLVPIAMIAVFLHAIEII